MLQMAGEARERKKKFSSSIEVLRFERTLELTKRQLRKTDNIARNDARLQSTMTLMFQEAKTSLRPTWNDKVEHAVTSDADVAVPLDKPQTGHCQSSQELADIRDSSRVISSVATMTASTTSIITSSSVVVTSVAMVTMSTVAKTTASFAVVSMATASSAVGEAAVTSCVSLPPNTNSSVANKDKTKLTSSQRTQSSPLPSAVPPLTATGVLRSEKSSDHITMTTDKSVTSIDSSADDVAVKSVDSVTEQSTDSADSAAFTCESVDSVTTLADAATVKSLESITVTAGKSADADAGEVMMMPPASVAAHSALFNALPISSPVPPLSNIKNLSTPQSPSPSPKGHVTFSDRVTEIQPSVGNGGGVNGKPRRIPPPPPRKALKNVTTSDAGPTSLQSRPRDRPSSAVEPLATVDGRPGYPTVNGVSRTRPLSMAPLATVDSDSDSSVGVESQTGTIRRNTARTSDKRNPGVELLNGGRGRTPPPVPTRKTSSLSSSSASATKNIEGLLTRDVQYSNLDDVRQECARLELASSGQLGGRVNGMKTEGIAKCEETEIY